MADVLEASYTLEDRSPRGQFGRIASLIENCKLNGVEPYTYLKATLEAIAKGHPAARIDELMPWNFGRTQHHIGQSQ
jgi:hypothetical protein